MATATFRQGADGYFGAVDTMVLQSSPTTIYGTDAKIGVDTGSNREQQVLLRFDDLFGFGASQIPLGATITSATLTLRTTNGSAQGGSFHRMLSGWSSDSTWNSLAGGVQIDGSEAVFGADVVTGATTSGSRAFDVTASVSAWAAGQANFGWVFKAGSTDGWDFASSETTNLSYRPLLTVTYDEGTTPPPAGLSITQSGGNTIVTEDGTADSFTVVLTSAPAANVTVGFAANPDIQSIAALTFTPTNWNVAQTVTVRAVDDSLTEGTENSALNLSASSADPAYSGRSASVQVAIIDNDGPSPAPPPAISPSVVRTSNTTQYKTGDPSGYGIGDPSALAYVPGMNALFIADSEHDESPYYSSTNLWAIRPDGSFIGAYSMRSFTREPTGLAYNPSNGYLYITDDDARKVFWVDPANPAVKIGEFSVSGLGITDAEDPKFDPVTGNIYLLDGVSRTLFELTPTGLLVDSIALPSEIRDAEGLAYAPQFDVFFISSGSTRGTIFEMDGAGNLLGTINTLNSSTYYNSNYGGKPYLKGLELALSSNPNDGDRLSLYAVDYGKDQQNDGRLFEIDLGPGWTSSAGQTMQIASLQTASSASEETSTALGTFQESPDSGEAKWLIETVDEGSRDLQLWPDPHGTNSAIVPQDHAAALMASAIDHAPAMDVMAAYVANHETSLGIAHIA